MRDKRGIFASGKRAQVTIFIIIAILLVVGIVVFFAVRGGLGFVSIPVSIQPAYNSFLSCLEDKTRIGIELLESQGGYIKSPVIGTIPLSFPEEGYAELPRFEEASPYMPFSSHLNLFGNQIPYWYYVSGNNLEREQVPTEQGMENELGSFIESKISECNFDRYYQEGFEIDKGEPTATVNILKDSIDVKLSMSMNIVKDEDSVFIKNHQISVKTKLGELYSSAVAIYNKEQKELFLEKYAVDTLRLYAPVDGVELSCSPKTWNADDVFNTLQEAIETNTLALTTRSPTTENGKYFYINTGKDIDAKFINSANWTNSFEVNPSESVLMLANPVGNQAGLGILGFCYVPYHFVYNVKYPVLVQVYSGEEVFQFPLAVIVEGNNPRKALDSTAKASAVELCEYKNVLTTVRTVDGNLNSVDSSISYECFGESCGIGQTSGGSLTSEFPQCVNGYIVARADGFAESKYLYSTVDEGSAEILMNKLYEQDVELRLDNAAYNGEAIIYFTSDETSRVISYPSQKKVNLSEGQYEISVYIYKGSSIKLEGTTSQQCMDVPSGGLGGIFGITQQKCFDIEIPSQIISNALAGGGKQEHFISENELRNANTIQIKVEGFTVPKTIEEFQNNYLLFEEKGLEIDFK